MAPVPHRTLLLGVLLVAVGAAGFHEIPGMLDPDDAGAKHVTAVYCSVITLTTVGYGDICPHDPPPAGKAFLVLLSFAGLGFFCGPIMDFAASWKERVPGGTPGLVLATVGLGVALFTRLEGWAPQDAAYYAVVTGTTIGYGDMAPKTDEGRIAAALYAVVAVNVVGALLDPAKEMLSRFVNEDVSFDDVDTDHDGNISKEEFAAMQKKQKKAGKDE